ncbi:unnamed protein product, partial [Pylaiella littoralis]
SGRQWRVQHPRLHHGLPVYRPHGVGELAVAFFVNRTNTRVCTKQDFARSQSTYKCGAREVRCDRPACSTLTAERKGGPARRLSPPSNAVAPL